MSERFLYIFLDESGNLDFSINGTKVFLFAGFIQERPLGACKDLLDLRYDLIESGLDIQMFHAVQDVQATRDRVFSVIGQHLDKMRIDALIVEKRKTHPNLQQENRFYPEMLGYFLNHVLKATDLSPSQELIPATPTL